MIFHNPAYFMAIVECGSLTKAAEQLYVSQPSLSQYLKRLESNLGVELFDRTSSPLRLTYVGERYYRYVKQVLKLDENVRKEFADIKSQTRGKLRLGVALWRGACLLPDVFPQFHERYPEITLELVEGRSTQLEHALMNDTIDVAIMNFPRSLDYNKLTWDVIFQERILLAAPTADAAVQELLASQAVTSDYPKAPLDFIVNCPLIMLRQGQNLTHTVSRALGNQHIEPNILLETGNLTTAINLVSTGIACTFVPEEGARICRRSDTVTYFAIDSPDLVWPLVAAYRKDAYLTNIAKLFIEELQRSLGSPGRSCEC